MNATIKHNQIFNSEYAPLLNPLYGASQPEFIRDQTLVEIFSATVKSMGGRTAIIEGERRLTYNQVDRESNRIAARLLREGIVPGDVVGLYFPRGADLLIAQIAIAKTGAAWLPFDAETPPDRINVCLKDAKAKGLLTSDAFAVRVALLDLPIWSNTDLNSGANKKVPNARLLGHSSDHIAYLIYTSGSTGVPKGIAITNRNICHYLRASNSVFAITKNDVMFQGCSAAFDLSMEEIWIPYLVGATLWVANAEIIADIEKLPARMREAGITAIDTVPTLLSMLVGDVPTLRTVILGGEACPPSLADRFATNGRRLFNSYGPTETTVVATIAQLQPGDALTIGKPIPNHSAYVVDEQMNLVAQGEKGELLIGGPGVAPGYLGRPDLTAQKFIANPFGTTDIDPILYRSGDAVSINTEGKIVFHGRIDDQIKIRGFRVELGEIETAIAEHHSVEHAAVIMRNENGIDALIAFVAPRKNIALDVADLRADLRKRLPLYMVPSQFEMIAEVPRLSSGKVDRKALKARALTQVSNNEIEQEEAQSPIEAVLLEAAQATFPGQAIPFAGDFFTDLGGHSLLAAQFISRVRKTSGCAAITLQDVYTSRTLRAMAIVLAARGATIELQNTKAFELPSRATFKRRILCGLAQAATLPLLLVLHAAPWLAIFTAYSIISADDAPFYVDMAMVFGAFFCVTLFNYIFVPLAKWTILGRTKPGVYPLWGTYYYRVWLVERLTSLVHLKWMQGTPVIRAYLRLLGAKVGKHALISELDAGAIDLISIGDHASLGGKIIISNARAVGDKFIIGPVAIGADVVIGSSSVIENDVTIGDGAELSDLCSLQANTHVPAYEAWSGSPACKLSDLDPSDVPEPATAPRDVQAFQTALYLLLLIIVPPIGLLPVVPAFRLMEYFDTLLNPLLGGVNYLWYMPLLALPAAASLVVFTALFIVAIRWMILPRVKPGTYSVFSSLYVRKWIIALATEVMLDTLSSIFATIYMRGWYRLMGARIGKGSEISTNLSGRYDLINIGEGNFIADDVQLGDEAMRRNWMILGSITTGSKVFIGNEAVIPMNYSVQSGALIGVKSRPPEGGNVGASETWFGSPPIKMPVRQVFDAHANATFEPSMAMKLGRAAFEAFNISLPTALFISLATYGMAFLSEPVIEGSWIELAFSVLLVVVAIDLAQLAIAVACKWISMGVYKPTIKPMWSWWALRTEAVAVMYWGMAGKALMEHLRGTPFLPMALRLFGVKIGKGVYMDATDITEFDCVTIGDHVSINAGACLQTHLYEDRLMKVGRIKVGNDVTIGAGSTVLYDTLLGDGSLIGPLTLVMKGEELPMRTSWVGSPAQPVLRLNETNEALPIIESPSLMIAA
jgi:non-ribosomal peptide synthetase-like protein